MGRCLNLSDSSALDEVQRSYSALVVSLQGKRESVPENLGKLKRLDCAVFEFLHNNRANLGLGAYDTVRSTYHEGEFLYPGTELRHQDHTQICVRNAASILGYFRPIEI